MSQSAACFAFARMGPLFRKLSAVPPAEQWLTHGAALSQQLNTATTAASADLLQDTVLASRIFHFYLPVFFWCRSIVVEARKTNPNLAVGIGLSAPQGCGKTTLVNLLTSCFERDGLVCAAVSFDDFYLTGAEQDILAATHPSNPLLQVRGNAGTHDIGLGTNTLRSLLRRDSSVIIPRYDKSARNGRGDRGDKSTWTVCKSADVVLLEGWMAGFAPITLNTLLHGDKEKDEVTKSNTKKEQDNADQEKTGMREINVFMERYSEWHDQMNSWVVVGIDDINFVYSWRLQAEHAMKNSGKNGMTDDQVSDFVSRYMPAYQTYLPALYRDSENGGVGSKSTLLVKVGSDRQVLELGK